MKTKSLHNQLVEWRQDLHMNPQIGFEEEYASNKVASLSFNLKVCMRSLNIYLIRSCY